MFNKQIEEVRCVLSELIELMIKEDNMTKFKNIAAVYIVWQHELHNLELLNNS